MRKVLVVEETWSAYAGEFLKREIELVIKKRASPEGVDAMLIPASAYPPSFSHSRKHHAPVLVYGTITELRDLRDSPINWMVETDAMTVDGLVRALQTLWREGAGGRELAAEEAFEEVGLSPRERETARQMLAGKSRDDSARKMGISEKTVRTMRTSVFLKTGVKNAHEFQAKFGAR